MSRGMLRQGMAWAKPRCQAWVWHFYVATCSTLQNVNRQMGSLTRKGDWLSGLGAPWILCQGVWNILYCTQKGQLKFWVKEWHDEVYLKKTILAEKVEVKGKHLEGNIVIVWGRNGDNLNRRKWRSTELVEFSGGGIDTTKRKTEGKTNTDCHKLSILGDSKDSIRSTERGSTGASNALLVRWSI